jgi:hypothetical protein
VKDEQNPYYQQVGARVDRAEGLLGRCIPNVRLRGALGFLLCAGLAVPLLILTLSRESAETLVFFAALPLAPAFCFLAVLIIGRPFGELIRGWDKLAGWQRGLLGTTLVLGFGSVCVLVGYAYLRSKGVF